MFGPHVLFSPKRDNIGIDVGSGSVKIANLLPHININQSQFPLLLKFKPDEIKALAAYHSDPPYYNMSTEKMIKNTESGIVDVQVLLVRTVSSIHAQFISWLIFCCNPTIFLSL